MEGASSRNVGRSNHAGESSDCDEKVHYLAHSANSEAVTHTLGEHLSQVAMLASSFAKPFGVADEAYLMGVLHDLGKYADSFQARLRGEESGLDHWTQGAIVALQQRVVAAALAIQGHHIGLRRGDKDAIRQSLTLALARDSHPLGLRLSEDNLDALQARLRQDEMVLPKIAKPRLAGIPSGAGSMLDVRMLFSCLVDADFLDTERHFDRAAASKREKQAVSLDAESALALVEREIARLQEGSAQIAIASIRSELWAACLLAAEQAPGLFNLTALTGAGKTLAMLGFALKHAARHGLRRVVIAIPYLSIIEQTARIYRELFLDAFGPNFVLEHHSLAGQSPQSSAASIDLERKRNLLAENWDAPIIVTTNVQLLESLFSNGPSACRKLHRLAKSVILFDEVQSLPKGLILPTLATLQHLTQRYHSTVVFSTATQPAFDALNNDLSSRYAMRWEPREIIAPEKLCGRLRRCLVSWPLADVTWSWEEVVAAVAAQRQALCIVNLKRHALQLAELLRADAGVVESALFFLSTSMCPAHRKNALARVRQRLLENLPCLLISTQCVEAGVDVDFPVLFRSFGPLEAIVQAAGRCNRNAGRERGKVVVFRPDLKEGERAYPDSAYEQAAQTTALLLRQAGVHGLDIDAPDLFETYYRELYAVADVANGVGARALEEAIRCADFPEVDRLYRLIEQRGINVVVPYDRLAFEELKSIAFDQGIDAAWMRAAQEHSIGIMRPKSGDPAWSALVPASLRYGRRKDSVEHSDQWYLLIAEEDYDNELLGFKPRKEMHHLIL